MKASAQLLTRPVGDVVPLQTVETLPLYDIDRSSKIGALWPSPAFAAAPLCHGWMPPSLIRMYLVPAPPAGVRTALYVPPWFSDARAPPASFESLSARPRSLARALAHLLPLYPSSGLTSDTSTLLLSPYQDAALQMRDGFMGPWESDEPSFADQTVRWVDEKFSVRDV